MKIENAFIACVDVVVGVVGVPSDKNDDVFPEARCWEIIRAFCWLPSNGGAGKQTRKAREVCLASTRKVKARARRGMTNVLHERTQSVKHKSERAD